MTRLRFGDVELRPMRLRDRAAWQRVRSRNKTWLQPWEATLPDLNTSWVPFWPLLWAYRSEWRADRTYAFVMTYQGELVGQVTVGGVSRGSQSSAYIGYWISESHSGRGITPIGVALATDFCFDHLGLNRVEINVRPENLRSIRLVEKLGFNKEGLRKQYLHIDRQWRDHHLYALVKSEVPEGLVTRLKSLLSVKTIAPVATRS